MPKKTAIKGSKEVHFLLTIYKIMLVIYSFFLSIQPPSRIVMLF